MEGMQWTRDVLAALPVSGQRNARPPAKFFSAAGNRCAKKPCFRQTCTGPPRFAGGIVVETRGVVGGVG